MGKLIMNGVPYGGGDVEANPSGTATDTLTKLGIEGTVYEIQGGGGAGGSSVYSEKVLWENASGVAQTTVVLNDSILKYDLMCIVSSTNSDRSYKNQQIIPVSQIDKSGIEHNGVVNLGGNVANNVVITYVDETHLNLSSWGSSNPIYYYKIVGLKLGTLSPIIYSTEEREIGVWTDNKPLYQKTWIETIPNASGFASFTNNPITNLDKVISTEYSVRYKGQQGETPWYTSASVYYDSMDTTGFSFYFNGTYLAGNYIVFTAKYTKTTDTAGSGEYNTLGIPNVHYDGNEKVIGTWFGETLYQQCIDLSSITISAGSTVTVATIQGINLKKALGTLTETDDTTYAIPDGGLRVKQYGDDIKLTAMGGSSWVVAIGKLIIEYTKTT